MLRTSGHGLEVMELVKGKDEQGSWEVCRKEEDHNLGGKLPKLQGWRSKPERDSWRDDKMPFWALFWNDSIQNLNYISHQTLKAIFNVDDPFFSHFFYRNRHQWMYFERPWQGFGTCIVGPVLFSSACCAQAPSRSWNKAFHTTNCPVRTFLCH